MKLTSPAFQNNASLPIDTTCAGKGLNPALHIADVPSGAQSLVLIVHDPDGVSGDFTHWLVWNIPPMSNVIPEGKAPSGALQGTNDYPTLTYGPACPPAGTGLHHYTFVLYAVDTMLSVPAGADRAALQAALDGHVLAQASLIGTVQA